MDNLVQDNKYLLMGSYTSVPIGCYFPPKCKDQGGEGVGCLFYPILCAQILEQYLLQSREPIDWMQFMATTSSCDWRQDSDEARILQEDLCLPVTWLFSPLSHLSSPPAPVQDGSHPTSNELDRVPEI